MAQDGLLDGWRAPAESECFSTCQGCKRDSQKLVMVIWHPFRDTWDGLCIRCAKVVMRHAQTSMAVEEAVRTVVQAE